MFFDLDDLADAITGARRSKRLSQAKLAEIAGVSRTTLSKIEHCAAPNVRLLVVLRILWGLDLDIRVVQMDTSRPTLDDLRRENWLRENVGHIPVLQHLLHFDLQSAKDRQNLLYDALRKVAELGPRGHRELAIAAVNAPTRDNLALLLEAVRGTIGHQLLLETLATIGLEAMDERRVATSR